MTPRIRPVPPTTPVERLGRLGLGVVRILAEGLILLDGLAPRRRTPPEG